MIDTLRVSILSDVFKSIDTDLWAKRSPEVDINKLYLETGSDVSQKCILDRRKYNPDTNSMGAYVEYYESTGRVTLDVSAKALGSRYLEGISENTYEQLIDNINKTAKGFYEIDKYRLLDSIPERIHNTVNVDCQNTVLTIQALKTVCSWNYKKNDNRFLTTAQFGNRQEKLTIYDKLEEIKNDNILKKMVNFKDPILRAEYKLENARKTRERYLSSTGIEQVSLNDVLKESVSKKLLSNIFNEIKINESKLSSEYTFDFNTYKRIVNSNIRLKETIMSKGCYQIFIDLNCNDSILLDALKERFKGKHHSSIYKNFRNIKSAYEKEKSISEEYSLETYNEIAHEFFNKLKQKVA